MRRSIRIGMALVGMVGFFCAVSFAQSTNDSLREQRQAERERARKEAEETAHRAKLQELESKIRGKLAAQEWKVYLIPSGPNSGKSSIHADTLAFTNIGVTSQYLSEKGFNSSNYSLTVKDGGSASWETLQRTPTGEMAFWKGDVDEQVTTMGGVLGIHPKKGDPQEYRITAVKPEGYVEPVKKPEQKKAEAVVPGTKEGSTKQLVPR